MSISYIPGFNSDGTFQWDGNEYDGFAFFLSWDVVVITRPSATNEKVKSYVFDLGVNVEELDSLSVSERASYFDYILEVEEMVFEEGENFDIPHVSKTTKFGCEFISI